jgi:hypothetical protein
LVVTVFLAWLMFQVYWFFQAHFKKELTVLSSFRNLFQGLTLGRGSSAPSISYSIVNWTREGSILLMGILALVGLSMLFRKKDSTIGSRGNTIFVVSYVSAAAALLVIPYGGEIFLRAFYILLPVLVFLVAVAFKGRQKVAVVFLVFLLLAQPIAYVGDECTTLTTNNDLYGAFFVQQHFPTTIKYFGPQSLIFYFDTIGQPHFANAYGIGTKRFNETYVVHLLTNSRWEIYCDSQSTRNYIAWYLGRNLTDEEMNFSALNRVYDSDGFTIFAKR